MLGSVPRRGRHRMYAEPEPVVSVGAEASTGWRATAAAAAAAPPTHGWGATADTGASSGGASVHFNSYDAQFARAHLCFEKEQAKLFDNLRHTPFAERLANPTSRKGSNSSGRERWNTLFRVLDMFGMERSDMQRMFHRDMGGACARLIFGSDLPSEIDDLLVELGMEELHSEFMAITARRTGKTTSVAMFAVSMMFAVPGLEQAIFSTGRRASQKLLELFYRLMCKIPGMKESIIKHNVETIWIQGPEGPDDVRKVFSYPSNVRISLRLCFVVRVGCGCCCRWVDTHG